MSPARPLGDQDAFGHALFDHLEGRETSELIERDDGYIDLARRGVETYFQPASEWPEHERLALANAKGRVLDIGCGAGRVLLELEERGLEVVGIDVSPLALEVCRRRGAKNVKKVGIQDINDDELGEFDTIVMMGNNFGLLANPTNTRRLLKRFHRMTSADAVIIAEVMDPYQTTEPFHLAYHERNREKGRMAGQLRIRIRYKGHRTSWYDYLFVSQDEMRSLVRESGWRVSRIVESGGPTYIGLLTKES
jgi:SAM-dependent methyltransferase